MYTAPDKLDHSAIITAKPKIIHALRICDADHNKVFVRRKIWNALQKLLAAIWQNNTKIHKTFKATVVQVLETSILYNEVEKVHVSH